MLTKDLWFIFSFAQNIKHLVLKFVLLISFQMFYEVTFCHSLSPTEYLYTTPQYYELWWLFKKVDLVGPSFRRSEIPNPLREEDKEVYALQHQCYDIEFKSHFLSFTVSSKDIISA